ncbi:MAG: HEAT repeat domain-containing protein [Aureliella sp.]
MQKLVDRMQEPGWFALIIAGCVLGCSDGGAGSATVRRNVSTNDPIANKATEKSEPLGPKPDLPPAVKSADQIEQIRLLEERLQNIPEARESTVSELHELAKASDTRVRIAASKALAMVGECSPESLESLLEGLRRPIGGGSYAVALNKLGEPAIPALLKELESEVASTRKNAAFCLGMTWSIAQAEQKIAALERVVELDSEPFVRHQAAVAIGILASHEDVDPKLKELVVPTLTKQLRDPAATVEHRRHIVSIVGNMGHKAHPLIPAVIALLKDNDAKTRANAAVALGMLASPHSVRRGKVVDDSEPPEYRAGSESTSMAVKALISALSDANSEVRAKAAMGLGYIGKAAAGAEATLTLQLKEEEAEPRLRAAESLVRIVADPSAAVPILEAAATMNASKTLERWWKTRAQGILEEMENTESARGQSE